MSTQCYKRGGSCNILSSNAESPASTNLQTQAKITLPWRDQRQMTAQWLTNVRRYEGCKDCISIPYSFKNQQPVVAYVQCRMLQLYLAHYTEVFWVCPSLGPLTCTPPPHFNLNSSIANIFNIILFNLHCPNSASTHLHTFWHHSLK